MGIHATVALCLLLHGEWLSILINAPLLAFHGLQLTRGRHLYDPTEVFRRLNEHKRDSFIKLAFYLFLFFYYLYRIVAALIAE